jgi:hypothetical protein
MLSWAWKHIRRCWHPRCIAAAPCRVATTGLLALLCCTYPALHLVFISLISLDIFSHWFQMYASLLAGSSTHKVRTQRRQLMGRIP